jgi:hypothetical protein
MRRDRGRQRVLAQQTPKMVGHALADDLAGGDVLDAESIKMCGCSVVGPANSIKLSCLRAVEGTYLSAWKQGHDSSVAGPDG